MQTIKNWEFHNSPEVSRIGNLSPGDYFILRDGSTHSGGVFVVCQIGESVVRCIHLTTGEQRSLEIWLPDFELIRSIDFKVTI